MRMPKIALLFVLFAFATTGSGAEIGGGSSLMTQTQADQIENWIGKPVRLTRAFTSVPGDGTNANSFHYPMDGRGPTITLVEVLNAAGGAPVALVGGYKPAVMVAGISVLHVLRVRKLLLLQSLWRLSVLFVVRIPMVGLASTTTRRPVTRFCSTSRRLCCSASAWTASANIRRITT